MFKSAKTNALLLVYYCFFTTFKVYCNFINLNHYIDIFPPTYFVKVHVDNIFSENLGPSKVPLTILVNNNTIHSGVFSKSWCKFFPVGRNFIGYRTQNTVNLISLNIERCYSSSKGVCFFMDFVHGKIKDGRRVNSLCEVSGDRMHTLIIAEVWEHDLIKQDLEGFWRKVRGKLYPNFALVFDSDISNSVKILCVFKFRIKRSFYCIETNVVSETILRGISIFPVSWSVGKELNVSEMFDLNLIKLRELYSKKSLDEILLIDTLRRANESTTKKFTVSTVSQSQEWKESRVSRQSVLVGNIRRKFLSCFSKPVVKFEMYVKPFQVEVWFSMLLCCSLIAVLISLYNMKLKLSESFSPYFFFVSTLFEEPYSVPSVLWNNRVFKTVTITWLLTAMIFTNLYIGLMISDVTSPLQGQRLVSFDEVLDTKIVYDKMSHLEPWQIMYFWLNNYTHADRRHGSDFKLTIEKAKCNVNFVYLGYKPRYRQFESQENFAILQKPVEDCGTTGISIIVQKHFLRHPWMYSEFKKLEKELSPLYKLSFNKLYMHRAVAFFSPRNRHSPRDPEFLNNEKQLMELYSAAAIEKELVACNRSIFMGDSRELKYELSYLIANHPTKGFYMPEETFENGGSNPVLWGFINVGRSKVVRYFKLLIESGIREGITGIRMHKHYLMRRNGTKLILERMQSESSVGMFGSIQTIFFIFLFLLAISSLVFTIEVAIKGSIFRRQHVIAFWESTKVLTVYMHRLTRTILLFIPFKLY
jgi:hypothetical protein